MGSWELREGKEKPINSHGTKKELPNERKNFVAGQKGNHTKFVSKKTGKQPQVSLQEQEKTGRERPRRREKSPGEVGKETARRIGGETECSFPPFRRKDKNWTGPQEPRGNGQGTKKSAKHQLEDRGERHVTSP